MVGVWRSGCSPSARRGDRDRRGCRCDPVPPHLTRGLTRARSATTPSRHVPASLPPGRATAHPLPSRTPPLSVALLLLPRRRSSPDRSRHPSVTAWRSGPESRQTRPGPTALLHRSGGPGPRETPPLWPLAGVPKAELRPGSRGRHQQGPPLHVLDRYLPPLSKRGWVRLRITVIRSLTRSVDVPGVGRRILPCPVPLHPIVTEPAVRGESWRSTRALTVTCLAALANQCCRPSRALTPSATRNVT